MKKNEEKKIESNSSLFELPDEEMMMVKTINPETERETEISRESQREPDKINNIFLM